MANTRTIKISALNVAMHQPHSPQRYEALILDAKKLKMLVRLGSLHCLMLGSLYKPKANEKNGAFTGEIYRFVKLDPSEPWFNTETFEAATENEVGKINIPQHLLPHLQRIEFAFFPHTHELWYVSQDRKDRLGTTAAVKFFQTLFDQLVQTGRYPDVEVTAIPDKESLDNMFKLHKLDRITIDLKRPNADDAAKEEAHWLRRLEKQGVRRIKTEMVAARGETIKPDAETRALAHVAARNGNVFVIGHDANGVRVEESTAAKPMALSETVDSDLETSLDVLQRTANSQ